MNVGLAFLKRVLPSEGHYIVTTKKDKGPAWNQFCDSIEILDWEIRNADARGETVYHACASYREARHDPKNTPRAQRRFGRTAHNVALVKSFWLDIDIGRPGCYPDLPTAIQALGRFCRDNNLPPPLLVQSGVGLHAYWPLDRNITADTWLAYAEGLKSLCVSQNLLAGPERTADVSSILRTPGTTHRKSTPKPVVLLQDAGPYPIEAFGGFLNGRQDSTRREPGNVTPGQQPGTAQGAYGASIDAAIANTSSYEAAYPDQIASLCAQLRGFKSNHGRIPEPLWYAGLGVLAYAHDGDRTAHEWSAGHANYSFEETAERLDRARNFGGATTCQRFHALDSRTCEQCPFWGRINSPISLGRSGGQNVRQSTIHPAATPQAAIANSGNKPPANGGPQSLPQLPQDYAWDQYNRLVLKSSTKNGADVDILISTYPIYLDGVQTGEVRGEYNLLFKQFIPARGWTDINISAKTLFGSQGAAELASAGANVHDTGQFIRFVRHAWDTVNYNGQIGMRFDQYGWKQNDTSFLLGNFLYSASSVDRAAGSQELDTRNQWLGPIKNGSIENWRRAANMLFAKGCEAQSLALLASFAAPLMRFMSRDEGGAIVSLVTRRSGTGKSVALAGAASVWGHRQGLGLTNEDTKVAKLLTLGALGNLPVVYDEIATRDPVAIQEFVINFTNGRDKMRGTRGGEIRHTASTWQTVLISASNGSLISAIESASASDAAKYRVLEVPLEIPPHVKHAIGDKLHDMLIQNAGYAGDIYMRWLVQPANRAWVMQALETYSQQIWERTKLKPEHRFRVRTATAVAVAAVIAKQLNLIEFSVDRIVQWLIKHIAEFDIQHDHADNWAQHAIGEFMREHVHSMIVCAAPYQPGRPAQPPLIEPRREMVMRAELTPPRMLVAITPLKKWLAEHEMSWPEFCREMINEKVMLEKQVLVNLGAGTPLSGARVWCASLDINHEKLQGVVSQHLPVEAIRPVDDALAKVVPLRR